MKHFIVSLTKSYTVEVDAPDIETAKKAVENYTSNITDISTDKERKEHNFKIGNIDCIYNEVVNIYDREEDVLYSSFDN